MKKSIYLACTLFVIGVATVNAESKKPFDYRWAYFNIDQFQSETVEKVRNLAKICSENGLNGIMLRGAWERLDLESPYTYKVVAEYKRIADQYGLELIPSIMSVGYNAFMLQHDKNLAEGLPVKDALYLAGSEYAVHVPDPATFIVNGGFEQQENGQAANFTFPYEKKIAWPDDKVAHSGKYSLRFEKFGAEEDEGRLIQTVKVTPNRLYKISFWVKTEGLNPGNPFGSGLFRVEALGGGVRRLTFFDPQVPGTTDWRKVEVGFNSKSYSEVEISVGVWEGKTGRFWVDDLQVEEIGMVNLLRRPGCPLVVRDEESAVEYTEGLDFERVEDIQLNFLFDHDGPSIKLRPGGRIKEGSRLRVSFYQGTSVYQGQTPICMSEPAVYNIWKKQIKLFDQVLGAKTYLLSADEIRVAASCEACKKRGLSAARILGDCLTRQVEMVREVVPDASIVVWSDMFDPNHNANKRDYYYLVDEDFYGAWDYIPDDLTMLCWYGERAEKSLSHFDSLGIKCIAAAYYDRDDLSNVEHWLDAMEKYDNAAGIMYTTWLEKFDLLDDFGQLLIKRGLSTK